MRGFLRVAGQEGLFQAVLGCLPGCEGGAFDFGCFHQYISGSGAEDVGLVGCEIVDGGTRSNVAHCTVGKFRQLVASSMLDRFSKRFWVVGSDAERVGAVVRCRRGRSVGTCMSGGVRSSMTGEMSDDGICSWSNHPDDAYCGEGDGHISLAQLVPIPALVRKAFLDDFLPPAVDIDSAA